MWRTDASQRRLMWGRFPKRRHELFKVFFVAGEDQITVPPFGFGKPSVSGLKKPRMIPAALREPRRPSLTLRRFYPLPLFSPGDF